MRTPLLISGIAAALVYVLTDIGAGLASCATTGGSPASPCAARTKVAGQWNLDCLVQHIEKLAHRGYAQ